MLNRVPSKSPYTKKEKIKMGIWWIVEACLFRPSFHHMNNFRCNLLRLFGSKVGQNTFISPKAKIWHPWNLEIGNNSGIGFDALIYNLDKVTIGDYATISQRTHINTGSHDYTKKNFPLLTRPVKIHSGAFIGTDSYIGWGVSIGEMCVIGARSVVINDQPANYVCFGHPCKPQKIISNKNES